VQWERLKRTLDTLHPIGHSRDGRSHVRPGVGRADSLERNSLSSGDPPFDLTHVENIQKVTAEKAGGP
jgi:hypothetical protein